MFWYDHLYLGRNCIYRVNRLKYKITHRMPHPSVYLITLSQGPNTVLEMIPSNLLMQETYPRETLKIIGIGATRGEALELIRQIVDEVYQKQGNFDIAAYMESGK